MECFTYSKTSNGTQGAREVIQCGDGPEKQYCFMVYSITEDNYDSKTNKIIDTNDIVVTNGKCIGLQDNIDVGRGIGLYVECLSVNLCQGKYIITDIHLDSPITS